MIAESSWVSIVTVKCLLDDMKPVFGWIFGRCLSHHIFILLGVLLLGILLELSLSIHSRVFIYQVVVQSMHFHFSYNENTKILGIFHCLEFWSFESLSFSLVHVKKDCIFIHNCRIELKIALFKKHVIYWKLKLGLCIVFIFTLLVESLHH